MKKLMILAAACAMGIAAQAGNIQWSAMNFYIPEATDVTKDQSGIVASTGTKFAAGDLSLNVYWVSTAGDVFVNSYNTTSPGAVNTKTLGGVGSTIYTAMEADHDGTWKPQYHCTATYETKDGTYTYSGYVTSTKTLNDVASKNVLATQLGTAGSWDYKAAPEPTSAMLLLLGVAGLALKRKQK